MYRIAMIILNNPARWHLRAQETRLLATRLEARAATPKIAEEHEWLAVVQHGALEKTREQLTAPSGRTNTRPETP